MRPSHGDQKLHSNIKAARSSQKEQKKNMMSTLPSVNPAVSLVVLMIKYLTGPISFHWHTDSLTLV